MGAVPIPAGGLPEVQGEGPAPTYLGGLAGGLPQVHGERSSSELGGPAGKYFSFSDFQLKVELIIFPMLKPNASKITKQKRLSANVCL